eukprot:3996694-Amphidinium_carterae.2
MENCMLWVSAASANLWHSKASAQEYIGLAILHATNQNIALHLSVGGMCRKEQQVVRFIVLIL